MPPNSNTFSDWKRTRHVSWVKTQQLPRANKTHKLPRKQRHELSTLTWPGRAPWNRGKFVSQMVLSKRFLRSFFFYFWVWLRLGEHWGSRGNKIHCWNQSWRSESRFYMWRKLVKKSLNGQCPQYFINYFSFNKDVILRTTRQSNLLHLPSVRTETAKRAFYYHGCTVFNNFIS